MCEDRVKKGIYTVNQFFDSMEKLKSEVAYFEEECKNAIIQKYAFFKVYGLSYNLAWTLRGVIYRLDEYGEVLRNTLLYDYFEENRQYIEDVNLLANRLDAFITQSLDPYTVDLIDEDWVGIDMDGEEVSKILIEDNEYLENISRNLCTNSDKLYRIILFYIRYIHNQLIEVRNIRLNRTESDYQLLFEREFKEFLTTDNWNDLRESFIDTTISMKYRGEEPTIEQLCMMRDDEFAIMQDLRKDLGSFDAYLTDYSKLARHIVNKEIKHNVNNPVKDLFTCFGRIQLIDKWIDDLKEEAPLMEAFADASPSASITFSARLSEKRLITLWPQIEELYKDRKAIDLVCLYHVLVYRNYISCDDFKFFVQWINQHIRVIIKEQNIRQIKTSYWVKEAKRMWTINGYHAWRNSTKGDTIYKDYEILCDAINEIVK